MERIRARRPGMSVLVATAYMDEAERFRLAGGMHGGKVVASARLRAEGPHRRGQP